MRRSARQTTEDHATTRKRLIEAAGSVFGEVGYRQARVRDIVRRAGANIAAINYHFGGKESLYAAAMRYGMEQVSMRPEPPDPALSPEHQLRALVHRLLQSMLDDRRPAWHGAMMAREMIEPTPMLNEVIESVIRPMSDAFTRVVRVLIGADVDKATLDLAVRSVIGQITFYKHGCEVIRRLYPDQPINA
ncbi:MAG TPA: CerR family C-terminal domain-containing protein, partial [Tepidisphaeraceae bacterium]|nr:CerR family C-terminal domain-containing protein [Tepidisphaeraceae bacterium]